MHHAWRLGTLALAAIGCDAEGAAPDSSGGGAVGESADVAPQRENGPRPGTPDMGASGGTTSSDNGVAGAGGGAVADAGGGAVGDVGGQTGGGGEAATGGNGGAAPARVGDACGAETNCPAGGSGEPRCLTDWPGGYCAVVNCAGHGHDCPEDPGFGGTAVMGSRCVLAPQPSCLALCATDEDCRDGYLCGDRDDAAGDGPARVCVPRGP